MNVISKDIELIKENISCVNLRVYHFEEEIKCTNKKDYRISLICCEFKNEKDLNDNWKVIVDNVALYVQSNFKKYIELYNVYVIFFIDKVSEQLLSKIEQDKYSSRKIVIRKEMPETTEEIEDIIAERLFYFSIDKPNKVFSISDILSSSEKEFYEYLSNKENIKDEDIEDIVDILNKDKSGGEFFE